ncbi:hypothetical protein ACFQU7_08820 [Pseudoroseomonas wenyumeiae]
MAAVKGRDTKPEIAVRRLAHALGYRFRLQRRDLPGSPDLVFPARRKAVFVHGCFWHQHQGCKAATIRGRARSTGAPSWRAMWLGTPASLLHWPRLGGKLSSSGSARSLTGRRSPRG